MDAKLTGKLIARKRKELGLSQAELAEQVHVTDKAISRWETGRGMPAVDSLEPLAAALGLTVSELLSGRELTAEELPGAAQVQIVDSLRKNNRMLWKGVLATVLALLTVAVVNAGVYLGYHFFTTAKVTDTMDFAGIAETQWPGFEARKVQKRGDFAAVLLQNDDGHIRMCVYERDDVFENRWDGGFGKPSVKSGELSTWNYGSPEDGAVIIVCGSDLPEGAAYYTFRNNGTMYLRPVNGLVLDVFVIPDGVSDISAVPILLDQALRPVDKMWNSYLEDLLYYLDYN